MHYTLARIFQLKFYGDDGKLWFRAMPSEAAIVKLNPAQQKVVSGGLLTSGFNCVLQMSTGAGKTWLAEQAIAAVLDGGARAIYLTPLRALANELVERWRRRFKGHEVGVFTGDFG